MNTQWDTDSANYIVNVTVTVLLLWTASRGPGTDDWWSHSAAAGFNEATGDWLSNPKPTHPSGDTNTQADTQQALVTPLYAEMQSCSLANNVPKENVPARTLGCSVFTDTRPSQTLLMSLRGQKIKLDTPRVSHVNHNMVSCIYNVTAISEITALKCVSKYPCITALKYRPKNPRLYLSEIKPLGLIHIQSLVCSRAVGLYNLVLTAVMGKAALYWSVWDERLDTVRQVDLYLAACLVCTVKTWVSFLFSSARNLGH